MKTKVEEFNHHIITKVKEAVTAVDKNSVVILFGSRARGNANTESDWDFMVLTSQMVTPQLRRLFIERILEIELAHNICIQLLIKEKNDWETKYSVTPIYKNINKEGVTI